MGVIDKAVSHYKSQIDGDLLGPILVPEWDNTEIYYKAPTGGQEDKYMPLIAEYKTGAARATIMILRCLDSDGNRMFKESDRHALQNKVDSRITSRICAEMGFDLQTFDDDETTSADEAEKNLKKT